MHYEHEPAFRYSFRPRHANHRGLGCSVRWTRCQAANAIMRCHMRTSDGHVAGPLGEPTFELIARGNGILSKEASCDAPGSSSP